MAKSPELLVAQSVLDRLGTADDWPMTRAQSIRFLRDSIKRNLEWLLNTRRSPIADLENYPLARKSVLSYGAPGLSSLNLGSDDDQWRLQQAITEIIEHSEFDVDLHELSGIWRYGSVIRSWLLELLHKAFEEHGNKLEDIAPYVEDSGEGRWTIHEAMAEDVPVPVITAALFARFASRQDESFAAKVNAALRNQFGGHAVEAAK